MADRAVRVGGVEIRPLARAGELRDAVVLDGEIWSPEESTPVSHMVAAIEAGGVVLGAYPDDLPGLLAGFVYAFPAWRREEGPPWLFSQAMAVRPAFRGAGIGQALKWRQREWALAHGYLRITWTWDPMEARNGFLNLERLGAVGVRYLTDLYGEMRDGRNRGVPSDRLWAEWILNTPRVRAASGRWHGRGKEVRAGGGGAASDRPGDETWGASDAVVCIAIPPDWQGLRRDDPDRAREERLRVRAEVGDRLAAGWTVTGFRRGCGLVLAPGPGTPGGVRAD